MNETLMKLYNPSPRITAIAIKTCGKTNPIRCLHHNKYLNSSMKGQVRQEILYILKQQNQKKYSTYISLGYKNNIFCYTLDKGI